MYLMYNKKPRNCKQCEMEIGRREECVLIRWMDVNGYYRAIFFHPECYIEHEQQYIENWFNQHPRPEPRKRGRKPKSMYPELYARKKALMRYHKKAGNVERAEEISEELRRLEIGV